MKSYKEKHSDIIALKLNKLIKNDRMEKQKKVNEYGKYKPYEVHKTNKVVAREEAML